MLYAERRRKMLKHSFPSIEQLAAFLDGNLSQSEMQQLSQMAEHDSVLHQLLDASAVVDNTLAGFTDADLKLPPEIERENFDLPVIPTEGISQLITLSPEPMGDMLVAASACADEDVSMFSTANQEGHITIEEELPDDNSHLIPESDGFDNSNDPSSTFLEDL
jgi:hypothetical protein